MPTDLADRAEAPPDFELAPQLPDLGTLRLQSMTVVDADEIPSEYPQFGSFIETVSDAYPDGLWIECPQGLAAELVDAGISPGDPFRIVSASKGETDRWEFEVEAGQD